MRSFEPTTFVHAACKLCAPIGAAFAFRGIERSVCVLAGNNACTPPQTRDGLNWFGSRYGVFRALDLAWKNGRPRLIGVTNNCIGVADPEDLGPAIDEWLVRFAAGHTDLPAPTVIPLAASSFRGTYRDGFQHAVQAIVRHFASQEWPIPEGMEIPKRPVVNLITGLMSCADLLYFRDLFRLFHMEVIVVPDYSQTAGQGLWDEMRPAASGGTSLRRLTAVGRSAATIELGAIHSEESAGMFLQGHLGVPLYSLNLPIGLRENDRLLAALGDIAARTMPPRLREARSRLEESIGQAQRYIKGLPVMVYGEEDFVASLATFLAECGIAPVLCATASTSGLLEGQLREAIPQFDQWDIRVVGGADLDELTALAPAKGVRLVVGTNRGLRSPVLRNLPLIRAGFPLEERFGEQRTLHVGFEGAQQLLDRIVNTILEIPEEGVVIPHVVA